jgi:hypothetical protein
MRLGKFVFSISKQNLPFSASEPFLYFASSPLLLYLLPATNLPQHFLLHGKIATVLFSEEDVLTF